MPDDPAEPFYDAIRAAPDDDLPRLVFADWLDENGDPERAEYIRLTCEIAREPDGERKKAWQVRADELFRTHRGTWFGTIPELLNGVIGDVKFDRGFITQIQVSAGVLTAHANQFDRFVPVLRHTHVSTVGESAGAVLWSEPIRRVASLSLGGVTPASLDYLTAHTELPGLDRLALAFDGCATSAEASRFLQWCLAIRSPRLALNVRFQSAGGPRSVIPVALSDQQSAQFIRLIRFPNLTGLTLDRVDYLSGSALVEWTGGDRLESLFLLNAQPRVDSFLRAAWLPGLQHLLFWTCTLDEDSVTALAGCQHLKTLKSLALSGTRLSDRGVYTLVGSPHLPADLRLLVSNNPFSSHAAARLRERFPNVRF